MPCLALEFCLPTKSLSRSVAPLAIQTSPSKTMPPDGLSTGNILACLSGRTTAKVGSGSLHGTAYMGSSLPRRAKVQTVCLSRQLNPVQADLTPPLFKLQSANTFKAEVYGRGKQDWYDSMKKTQR